MNKAILCGRLVRDPEVKYSGQLAIAKYTLAVDRKFKKNDEATADFIPCVAMGKTGEFAEKYLHQGTKILVVGRIQTGSYTNKEGKKVHTTDVIVEEHEFVEGKNANVVSAESNTQPKPAESPKNALDTFMSIPDSIEDDFLPFN